MDDTSDKKSAKDRDSILDDSPAAVKQIIMSSDSSSVKEEEKKDEEEDKVEGLLKVKKKRAPMLRLNSKAMITMLDGDNVKVSSFKEKLEEGLK